MTERPPRPSGSAPAFDGMDLAGALTDVFGGVPEKATLERLRGDASSRIYYRIRVAGQPNAIVMRWAPDAPRSDEGAAPTALQELPFINMQRHLARRGVPVPRVLANHAHRGILLLEDLGDETFEARLRARPLEWEALYGAAVDLLAAMHSVCEAPAADCIAYQRSFDRDLLTWELHHFREWGVEATGLRATPSARATFDGVARDLVERLLALPQGFVHRDYQSRNLMWKPDGSLVVIDFQDALRGPAVYDLVSLLCDSYVDLGLDLQRALIGRYARLREQEPKATERAFWLTAVHRKLKDAGRFVFIDQVRGNPDFLPWYAPSLRYVGRALSALPELSELGTWLLAQLPGFPDEILQPIPQTGRHAGRSL